MELATNLFPLFSFRIFNATKRSRHVLIFFKNYCVQHFFIAQYAQPYQEIETDLTRFSPFIGLTSKAIERRYPRYKIAEWEIAIYFFEREPDPICYIASRLETFKELTAEKHMSRKFIRTLLEAK